jgi:hypothetical protein
VTAPLVSSRRRKKATGHIKLRIGFVSAADSTAESKGAPTVDFRTAYDYLLKRSEERNILTVPAFKGIGTTKGRSGENGDDSDDSASSASELQDDGLSSDSSSDEDEGDDSPASAPTSVLVECSPDVGERPALALSRFGGAWRSGRDVCVIDDDTERALLVERLAANPAPRLDAGPCQADA